MSKYGSGLTFGQVCNLEKAEIKQALAGKVIDYYDDDENPVYRDGTKEETDRVILEAYDEAVFQGLQAMASGRALERLLNESVSKRKRHQIQRDYMGYAAEELTRFNDYVYEDDCDDN